MHRWANACLTFPIPRTSTRKSSLSSEKPRAAFGNNTAKCVVTTTPRAARRKLCAGTLPIHESGSRGGVGSSNSTDIQHEIVGHQALHRRRGPQDERQPRRRIL